MNKKIWAMVVTIVAIFTAGCSGSTKTVEKSGSVSQPTATSSTVESSTTTTFTMSPLYANLVSACDGMVKNIDSTWITMDKMKQQDLDNGLIHNIVARQYLIDGWKLNIDSTQKFLASSCPDYEPQAVAAYNSNLPVRQKELNDMESQR